MNILLTNDDGYDAPGLAALLQAAAGRGKITVVAPQKNHSGASSSLSLHRAVAVQKRGDSRFAVDGTPADCVHLALTGGFIAAPDLIISGINEGANMGDDTLYSGTVAAAIEGHLFNIPAVAFSVVQKPARHFSTAVAVARFLIKRFIQSPSPQTMLLNVNIPDIPLSELKGIRIARLGRRHIACPAILKETRADGYCFEIGEAGEAKDDADGTDFFAIKNNAAAVTPLMVDLTRHEQIAAVKNWMGDELIDKEFIGEFVDKKPAGKESSAKRVVDKKPSGKESAAESADKKPSEKEFAQKQFAQKESAKKNRR